MFGANLRKWTYFALVGLRGQRLGARYAQLLRDEREGIPPDTIKQLLVQLLEHCKHSVPYYAEVMRDLGDSYYDDPQGYLGRFPILTKAIMRQQHEALKSVDLERRKWYRNASGGSTGNPAEFVQDREFSYRAGAITLFYGHLVGREVGEPAVYLWGSDRDITHGGETLSARLANRLTNTTLLNAYRMSRERMHEYIKLLNTLRPKLIVAYADAIYELARFAEGEKIEVLPQQAIMTSAVTLYPSMRQTIERVFGCRVYNRYGSREMGDIACECPGVQGLWVAPWGTYLEVVDERGHLVPEGVEGEILATSLTNMAMPLVRYRIGDMGMLAPQGTVKGAQGAQVLDHLLGRSADVFRTRNGGYYDCGYFESMLYFQDWVHQFQIVQKDYDHIMYRIVPSGIPYDPAVLDEISARARLYLGEHCLVTFDFVDDIAATGSGKYRVAVCEIDRA
jgi:phenylacetate-CoA ligase